MKLVSIKNIAMAAKVNAGLCAVLFALVWVVRAPRACLLR